MLFDLSVLYLKQIAADKSNVSRFIYMDFFIIKPFIRFYEYAFYQFDS